MATMNNGFYIHPQLQDGIFAYRKGTVSVPTYATIWSDYDRIKKTAKMRFRPIYFIKSICSLINVVDDKIMGKIENFVDREQKTTWETLASINLFNGNAQQKYMQAIDRFHNRPHEVAPLTIDSDTLGVFTGLSFTEDGQTYYEVYMQISGEHSAHLSSYLFDKCKLEGKQMSAVLNTVPRNNGIYYERGRYNLLPNREMQPVFPENEFFVYSEKEKSFKYIVRNFRDTDDGLFRCWVPEKYIDFLRGKENPNKNNDVVKKSEASSKKTSSLLPLLLIGGAGLILWGKR